EDEHDDEERALLEPLPDGSYTADARIDLDELTGTLGETFQIGDIGEDVDTLGGLLFTLLGRIPVRGELIDKLPGFEFEVTDADPRRIKRLRIYPAGMRRRDTRRRRGSSRTAETVAAPETAETETARKETGAGQV
ncbi:MAG: magnesium/cobalt efflux protein, partial [Hyphomicrobiaceae bacterium]|nr:magnesium/cobalt efflux protein [Hyphomicrobiaceae bacterium]